MRLDRWSLLAVGIAAAACASTIGPVIPSVQVLVVLDSLDDTLRIIPVDSPGVVHKVVLNSIGAFDKHALAVRGSLGAIAAHGNFAYTVDLISGRLRCTFNSPSPGSIDALIITDNGSVRAAQPLANRDWQFEPIVGATCPAGGAVVRGPKAYVSARSTVFVVAGNPISCAPLPASCEEEKSWLTASPDSIPLSLPGNAQGGVVASDGLMYVLNAGNGRQPNARLSQVDPVERTERRAYVGFGTLPRYIATDGERVFVASAAEGLMVFNTRTGQVERDANSFIPLIGIPRGLAADDVGQVYALIAGSCTSTGSPGKVQVLGADLVNKRGLIVGRCPVAIGVTDIPTTLYHFTP